MGNLRNRLADALGVRSSTEPNRLASAIDRAIGQRLESRSIANVPGAQTAEEEARIKRKQRLEQVKAALAQPEPPPAPAEPPPAPAEPAPALLSTADMLRNLIGQQPATGTIPLNGDRILTEAAQKVSAPGSTQATTVDELRRLLGRNA